MEKWTVGFDELKKHISSDISRNEVLLLHEQEQEIMNQRGTEMLKLILSMLLLIALISPAMGIGIQKAEFFDVEQGSTETILINFYTGNEPENNFTLQLSIPDDIKNWITVTPATFTLGGSASQQINVTVTVPKDAELGDRTGEIKYVGSRVMGGGQIGYTVATKTVLHFRVVKEGAKKEVQFLVIDAKPQIGLNQIAKMSATIKNSGNIPTTFHTSLHINNAQFAEVYTMESGAISLPVERIEVVTLFWEPNEEGDYTGYFKVAYDDDVKSGIKGTEVTSTKFKLTVGTEVSEPLFTDKYLFYFVVAVILMLILFGILLLRKRNPPTPKEKHSEE